MSMITLLFSFAGSIKRREWWNGTLVLLAIELAYLALMEPGFFTGDRTRHTFTPYFELMLAYPTAARPQAWAAGTPVLLLQVLLGLRPDRLRHRLESVAPAELPHWAGSLRLSGVRAFDATWDVRVREGIVQVEAV